MRYGNLPLEVAHSGSSSSQPDGRVPSKFEENGKKFGKKMGNAGMYRLSDSMPVVVVC
jgi:hypothetical protein